MKISEQWLREWINPPVDVKQLADQLTMAGLEVEGVESLRTDFSGVVVVEVQSVAPHPDAKKLKLCKVSTGRDKPLDIVCGAANVRVGMRTALAMIGAKLPGGQEIKLTDIRGVTSNGMLCSAAELGLADEADGILDLPTDTALGLPLERLVTTCDNILEISLTPNRGDCLSVRGIAREMSVLNQIQFRETETPAVPVQYKQNRQIKLDNPEACPCYVGRIIENVDVNRPSPLWLITRLQRCGIRSINPVVDITNYVMLELGQPMHAFDNDKLQGAIHVRFTKANEKLKLLDGQVRELANSTLVIADDIKPLAIAGVMGGEDSAVQRTSKTVFLESAWFNPLVISGEARRYGLHTDSSQRFERGVDFTLQTRAIERATQLIIDICGGKPGPVIEESRPEHLPVRKPVRLRHHAIDRLLGISLEQGTVVSLLQSLGMSVKTNADYYDVVPPGYRFDVSIEVDLIEELARIKSYDQIPSTPPLAELRLHPLQGQQTLIRDFQHLLVSRGYHEAITYSFVDKNLQELLNPGAKGIELANPIASELAVMRTSTWPGLMQALIYNLNRQQERCRLFETGLVFNRGKQGIEQVPVIGGVIYGNVYSKQWDKKESSSDYFDIKSDIEDLLRCCGINPEQAEFQPSEHPALHPGQSAKIIFENQLIGYLGALHPAAVNKLELVQSPLVFELKIDAFSKKITAKYKKLSKFPMIRRDLAVVVNNQITLSEVLKCIKKAASEALINLELFDVYQGEGIDSGKKSLAVGLTFQGSSSTLTDEDVEVQMGEILSRLRIELGGTLRE